MNIVLSPAAEAALATFQATNSWEQRARLLIQWGQRLEPLPDTARHETHQVHGCQSRVWLLCTRRQPCHFVADSDARLLKGLLALLLLRVEGLTTAELAELNPDDWFQQLGLGRQLSPSRSNGLQAVLRRMRELATDSD